MMMTLKADLICGVSVLGNVPVRLADEQHNARQRTEQEQTGSGDAHGRQLDEVLVGGGCVEGRRVGIAIVTTTHD